MSSRVQAIAVIAAAIVVAVVIGGWALIVEPAQRKAVLERAVASAPSSPSTASSSPGLPVGDLAASVKALGDSSKQWTLAVLGDSTGSGPDRWVHAVAPLLSTKYGRPVVIHDWSIKDTAYAAPVTVGSGNGKPIVIWNGSASGMNADYSYSNRTAMVPERPGMVIINHGHNQSGPYDATGGVYQLVKWASSAWGSTAPAVAVTLENPRTDSNADRQQQVVDALRGAWAGTGVGLIDANGAFLSSGTVPSLLVSDGIHPNPKGSALWASVVAKFLGA